MFRFIAVSHYPRDESECLPSCSPDLRASVKKQPNDCGQSHAGVTGVGIEICDCQSIIVTRLERRRNANNSSACSFNNRTQPALVYPGTLFGNVVP